jgi:hypothetical protein
VCFWDYFTKAYSGTGIMAVLIDGVTWSLDDRQEEKASARLVTDIDVFVGWINPLCPCLVQDYECYLIKINTCFPIVVTLSVSFVNIVIWL